MSLYYADRSKWRVYESFLTVYGVVFPVWDYTTAPCFGNYRHLSACYRNMLENNSVPKFYSDYEASVIVRKPLRVKEWTQWPLLCQLLIGMCEYLNWPRSLLLCLSWKMFSKQRDHHPHLFLCVLQSWHPESRHGDKTWTAGPRETCSLFYCSVTITSYLTPLFVTHYLIYHDIHTVCT